MIQKKTDPRDKRRIWLPSGVFLGIGLIAAFLAFYGPVMIDIIAKD